MYIIQIADLHLDPGTNVDILKAKIDKGDDFRTGIFYRSFNELHGILTGTQNKTGIKFATANNELIVVHHNRSFFLILHIRLQEYAGRCEPDAQHKA